MDPMNTHPTPDPGATRRRPAPARPVFVAATWHRHQLVTWIGRTVGALILLYVAMVLLAFLGVTWIPAGRLPLLPSKAAVPAITHGATAVVAMPSEQPAGTTPPDPAPPASRPSPTTVPPPSPTTRPSAPGPASSTVPPRTTRPAHPTHPSRPTRPTRPTHPTHPTHPTRP